MLKKELLKEQNRLNLLSDMKDFMQDLLQYIRQHTVPSGLFSIINIGMGFSGIIKVILGLISIIPILIGSIVGLITIYTWLEKKGLLPKWAQIPDKLNNKEKEENEK